MVVVPAIGREYKPGKLRKLKLTGAKITGTCATFLLLFVFGGNFTVQNVSAKSDQEELKDISTQAAVKVAVRIAQIKKQLNDLAKDESVLALFAEADTDALESEGEQKKAAFESALKLRLLLPGDYKTDREMMPPLSFASVDLLKRAEASKTNVAAEVHSFGSDGAHVAFVSRVTDADKKLLGLLHLSMPLSVIESVASTFDFTDTYVEIRQKAIALSKSGDAKLRQGLPVSIGIKGTKWAAASWNKSSATAVVKEAGETAEEGSSMGLIILILPGSESLASGRSDCGKSGTRFSYPACSPSMMALTAPL